MSKSSPPMGIILPVHPRHYPQTQPQVNRFLRTIRSTLSANGWVLAQTLYLQLDSIADSDPVPDRECWTIGDVKTNSKGAMTHDRKTVRVKVDWFDLFNTRCKTSQLRKLLLTHLDQTSRDRGYG